MNTFHKDPAQCDPSVATARRVLVVDDDEGLNTLAQKVLRRSGFETQGVLTGAEGIARVIADPGLTVLLDHKLPDMDGTELIRALIEKGHRVPFVAMTGRGNEQIAVEMMKLGAREYLAKGFNITDLLPEVFHRVFREVETERRLALAEQHLRESEERFKLAMEANRDGLWDCNVVTGEVYYSPNYAAMLGYTPSDILPSLDSWVNLIHPEDKDAALNAYMNCLENRCETFEIEFRMRAQNGHWRWILRRGKAAARDNSGRSTRMIGTHSDITRRKQAENTLTMELAVNTAMSELSGALISKASTFQDIADITLHYSKLLTGSDHGFVSVIDQMTGDNVGYTLTHMMGKDCQIEEGQQRVVFPQTPDGRYPNLWGHALNIRQSFYTNCPGAHPASGGVPAGHIPFRNFLAVPAQIGDKLIGLIALANTREGYTDRDLEVVQRLADLYAVAIDRQATVEALRTSEQQIRGLFNAATDSVMLLDETATILAINEGGAKRRGLSPQDMAGKDLAIFLPPDIVSRRLAGMKESAHERHWVDIEERHEDKYYHVRIFPILDDAGNAVQFATFSRDVTERNHMQALMIEAEKTTSIAGMAAGMAHEIKSPLSGIMQSAQVVLRRLSPDMPANQVAAREAGCAVECVVRYMHSRGIVSLIENMLDAASRMSNIVTGMLEFSRKSKSERVLSDINGLLEKSLELCATDYDLKKKYDFRHILIERDYAQDLPSVPCTRPQIEQVLTNLLRNAAQAMTAQPENALPPTITLRTRLDDTLVRIEVEDNGPGMEETVRKQIFDPFFTTKPEGEGTGLGLSVSHFIITNNHKGTIEVESWPGKGTRFTIRLPLTDG